MQHAQTFRSLVGIVFCDTIKHTVSVDDSLILFESTAQILCKHALFGFSTRRKLTYENWPGPRHLVAEVIKDGFYHTSVEDETVCVGCGLGLKQWSPTDNVTAQHFLLSPHCPYLAGRSIVCQKTATITGKAQSKQEPAWDAFFAIYDYLCQGFPRMIFEKNKEDCGSDTLFPFNKNEARIAIKNAVGLGHSAQMITLATYWHYFSSGKAQLPQNTVELLRAILKIEEEMEGNILKEMLLEHPRRDSESSSDLREGAFSAVRFLDADLPHIERFLVGIVHRRRTIDLCVGASEAANGSNDRNSPLHQCRCVAAEEE